MALTINLFGSLSITDGKTRAIRLPTRKSEALLAYLIERQGVEVAREVLSDLLWPFSGPDQARASLRQEMSVLRKALGPNHANCIVSQADRIGFCDETATIDLWRFRQINNGMENAEQQIEALTLYTAPFLDTFRIRSQPFTDWLWAAGQTLEAEALKLGTAALVHWLAENDAEHIVETAQHLCRIDPTYEPAHRALIETYLERGDAHLAKRQMEFCSEALRVHLDAEPALETQKLAARLASGIAGPGQQTSLKASRKTKSPANQQRRNVTILSIQANMQIADPEDFEHATAGFAGLMRQIVEANGGKQLDVFNDRVLAIFGYPVTHDRVDDTAVIAAFDILAAVENQTSEAESCQIGIAQGLALISVQDDADGTDLTAAGQVIGDAETLGRLAAPGAVLVDAAMQSLFSPAITLLDLPDMPRAKRAMPIGSGATARFYETFGKHSHAMVGRDGPLAHALGLLDQAKLGKGSVLAISGNPGEGKSRLVQEVAKVALDQGFEIRIFQGNPNDRQSTLAPVVNHMLGSGALENPAGQIPRQLLEDWLTGISPDLTQAAEFFEPLLAKTNGASVDTIVLSTEVKEKALDYFAAHARRAAVQRPALLIFEDAQWFDLTTCAAIERLIDAVEGAPLCALIVAREGEAPDVMDNPLVQKIRLTALDPRNAESLLRGLLTDVPVSKSTLADVLERAEGNPLFLEEFSKALTTQIGNAGGFGEIAEPMNPFARTEEVIAPPNRLLPLLLSRIDSVPGAIQVLQHASVLGRRFTLGHLSQVLHPVSLHLSLLEELEAAGIVFAARRGADASYIFKHAMIIEAIYSTIPMRTRPALHRAAAEVLLSDEMRTRDAEIARHFKAAEDHNAAAQYFEASGDKAARLAAQAEAIFEYSDALTMVGHLPSSQDRLRKELSINRKIAAQIIGLRGIPTSEATPFYTAAQELSLKLGDQEEVVNATWGLWSIHLMVAKLDACLETATSLANGLDSRASPETRLIIEYMFGVTHAYRGALAKASGHLENVRAIYTEAMKEELQIRFGMDIGLTADSFLGWIYALLDKREDADAASQRALLRAQRNNNGLSRVFAHVFSATKCLFLDQVDEARHHAETALKGAEEMQFKQWIAQARMQIARIADLNGEPEALVALQAALADYMSTEMVLARPYAQVWIAEAMIRRRQYTAALGVLDDLHHYTNASKEKYFAPRADNIRALALSGDGDGGSTDLGGRWGRSKT